MIYAKLTDWRSIPGFAQNEFWAKSFTWLETAAAGASEGIHPLGPDDFFARVMGYPLKTREQARYEMHRQTIDIQYTLEGREGIEIAAREALTPMNDYVEAKDAEHLVTPAAGQARVDNLKGFFTVLFPGEPHMPQLTIPGITAVRKVVVKLPARLVK